ncbi:MAG: relaxase/mobilization nuclease domain-containing protein [Bdellovibrionaceae bacterium]|nr:relaxase/mobilization nuclease domain-containing protein [Pseudobdellovibrionaceae bacterium]
MAFVRIERVNSPQGLKKYISKDRSSPSIEEHPEGATAEMVQEIEAEHARFPRKNLQVLSRTIIQAWSPSESNLHQPEKYNQMGRELAERWAPGHMAWVTTHTDKGHIHNHIVICTVNSETGKILDTKKKNIQRLHKVSNEICRENGLSEMGKRVKEPDVNIPKQVREMVKRGKNSWYADLIQKVDFARAASTGFDEYVGILDELGVRARVEPKNISYGYGDKKAIRGRSLGKNFDKDGLMKAFKENDERFANVPGLREQLRGNVRAAFDDKGRTLGTASDLLLKSTGDHGDGKKDYGKFTKIDRRSPDADLPAVFDERGGPLYAELKKAKNVQILDYCREHKIQTEVNAQGKTVLKGRTFVEINGNTWTNTKNDQRGGIVQFVAIHDETNYVRALAKINKNPRLLLFEQAMGEYKRGYQSFYIPKTRPARDKTSHALRKVLQAEGVPAKAEKVLSQHKGVFAGENGNLWMMNEKGDSALEFKEDAGGNWKAKRHGNPAGVFHESLNKSKRLIVFPDVFSYALFKAQGAGERHQDVSTLVFFGEGDSSRRLDEILALHSHITEVHMAHSAKAERRERDAQALHEVKRRLDPFAIEVRAFEPSGLGKDRGRGPDIGL